MKFAKDGIVAAQKSMEAKELSVLEKSSRAILAAGLPLVMVSHSAFADLQFKSYQTHSHAVIPVSPDVNYKIEKIEQSGKLVGLRLILEGYNGDLANPALVGDTRTATIRYNRVNNQIQYEFILNKDAVARGVEYFDYRNKTPSEIALDYWTKDGAQAHKSVDSKTDRKLAANLKNKAKLSTKSVKSIGAVGCGIPLDIEKDGYASFKTYHKPFDFQAYFDLETADQNYKYPELEGVASKDSAKEIAHYRLAHKLYKQQKYALTLRTIDFFNKNYKKSVLKSELEFLKASTLLKLSSQLKTDRFENQALDIYRSILRTEPESSRAKVTLDFLLQRALSQDKAVIALEFALMGAEPKSGTSADIKVSVYRLAAAHLLYSIGEFDRAERNYQAVIDSSNSMSAEAAYRIGEVFMQRQYWERAAIAFETAIRKYSNDAERFPTAFFNLAEVYMKMGRYDLAKQSFQAYLGGFESDSMGWAAALRLAEISQITLKKADPSKNVEIQKQYEFVVNHFPYSPGSVLAELRLSKCYAPVSGHDGVKDFFVDFFRNRDESAMSSEILNEHQVTEWFDYAEASFNNRAGLHKEALAKADEYGTRLDQIKIGSSFRDVFADSYLGSIQDLSKSNAAKELLAAVEHYGNFVKSPEPVSYRLAVAKAHMTINDFKGLSKQLNELANALPTSSDEEKDLYHYLKARCDYFAGANPDSVLASFVNIRDAGTLAVEKFEGMAKSSADKKDYRSAIAYDTRLLETSLVSKMSDEQRFTASVRRLENMAFISNAQDIAKESNAVLMRFGTFTQFPEVLARVRDINAQALYDSGQFPSALKAIDEVLSLTPEHSRRTEFEYMRGKIYARQGRESEAFEVFRRLASQAPKSPKEEVWKKSAQAELDQIQWENQVTNQLKDRRSSQ